MRRLSRRSVAERRGGGLGHTYLTDIPTDNPTICFDGNPDVAPRR
jgi:hypothetical protein